MANQMTDVQQLLVKEQDAARMFSMGLVAFRGMAARHGVHPRRLSERRIAYLVSELQELAERLPRAHAGAATTAEH